jgi:hypothetical protein
VPSRTTTPLFPPPPRGLRGRASELRTLVGIVRADEPRRVALVGQGGSGKSMLACALGHAVRSSFSGGIHWFRVGAWDARTLAEMLALRFGTSRERKKLFPALRRHLAQHGPMLIVLDNHEDDRAMALLLDELRDVPVTWLITARRCLLSGVSIFPVTAPLVTSGQHAFPRVSRITRLLRYNPLALDMADALVSTHAIDVRTLERWLIDRGVDRVRAVDHEDDLPEVSLLVDWAWAKLDGAARRVLAVLAHLTGDHAARESLGALSRTEQRGDAALRKLLSWHLVQEPYAGRYALHAVVRYAISKRTTFAPARLYEHYVTLLEQHPERLDLEQTHLFAAMDFAHATSNLGGALRIERLLKTLDAYTAHPPELPRPQPLRLRSGVARGA